MTERAGLMTVGDLAARTGLSIKMIRELEGRGLIYTPGRSPGQLPTLRRLRALVRGDDPRAALARLDPPPGVRL